MKGGRIWDPRIVERRMPEVYLARRIFEDFIDFVMPGDSAEQATLYLKPEPKYLMQRSS